MEHREFLKMVEAVEEMTAGQAEKLAQAIEQRDDLDEVHKLIEQSFERHKKCPHCGKTHLQRWSKSSGLQRWMCMSCNKTFNALTGTPLARMKKREHWLQFSGTLLQSLSVREAAKICSVSKNTSFSWRHRFLEMMNKQPEQQLVGVGEVDETFFLENFKGQRTLPRAAKKRGTKAQKRGLSKEQIPVLIARDRSGGHVDGVLPDRSKDSVCAVLKGRFSKDILLCMDEDAATIAFAKEERIAIETITASKGEHVVEGVIHVQNVNAYISRLKRWIKRFNGVATRYLSTYIGWRRLLEIHTPDSLTPKNCLISALRGNQQLSWT